MIYLIIIVLFVWKLGIMAIILFHDEEKRIKSLYGLK